MTPKALSREIKFRMWSIKDKFMDDTPIVYKGAPCTIDTEGKVVWMPQDDTVLMQYTGLLDKNGKEIYEGDIVQEGTYSTELVEFKDVVSCGCCNEASGYPWSIEEAKLKEVVGNIYENPELTKENK